MKKLNNIIFIGLSIWFISACGGSSDNVAIDKNQSIMMEVGKAYVISNNDVIIKKSEDSILITEVNLKTKKTIVTLKSGEAELYRKD